MKENFKLRDIGCGFASMQHVLCEKRDGLENRRRIPARRQHARVHLEAHQAVALAHGSGGRAAAATPSTTSILLPDLGYVADRIVHIELPPFAPA